MMSPTRKSPFSSAAPVFRGSLRVLGVALFLSLMGVRPAAADQARDWIIAAQPSGTDVFVDVVLPGAQLTAEHRVPIYGFSNQLTLRGNALYTAAFYESQADVELRILALTLGGTFGYHASMRNMEFEAGDRIDRHARRMRTVDGDFSRVGYEYAEGRATLSLPINDYVVFNAINSMRHEGRPMRSVDWRNGVVRDDGLLFRSDIMLFLKHKDWGGFAPLFQIMSFDLDDERHTQFNYGFMLVTRPGIQRANDLLFLQVLLHPGSSLGGYDNSDVYGLDVLFSPVTFLLAYRTMIPVWRPE
ncbi:MAG: hypothetical protein OEZ06_21260 [Myxococcales bacterium]|nr:hypothetical protein [Myxococcales bacterium]